MFLRPSYVFSSSRLDYCNSLFTSLNKSLLGKQQLVQNATAKLLCRTSHRTSISPVVAPLHWLPVKYRIDFKILLFTYKAFHNQTPAYVNI
ncbi:hypothetical protein LDENG_00040620 [Lucifuga dentata]|nr:hypothetical protein LDENG_00040620 [Lucifuga dentata]